MKQSKFLSLGVRDFLRGLAMSILTPAIVIIQQSLDAGLLVFNWKTILISGIAGGLAYLLKNVFTKPDVVQNFSSNNNDEEEPDPIQGGGTKNGKE